MKPNWYLNSASYWYLNSASYWLRKSVLIPVSDGKEWLNLDLTSLNVIRQWFLQWIIIFDFPLVEFCESGSLIETGSLHLPCGC